MTEKMQPNNHEALSAVLGMDIVGFSVLTDEEQLLAIKLLIKWIRSALNSHEIAEQDYHWSPAGDGGFLTFKTIPASEQALSIAFDILAKTQNPSPIRPVKLRFGLHAGPTYEGEELRGGTNIWGDGINMAARIMNVAADSQILVSDLYYGQYRRSLPKDTYEFGDVFLRTLKHGVRISVRNCRCRSLGLSKVDEINRRWNPIGLIWKQAVESYSNLIDDAVDCGDPIAALAAAKFLLEMNNGSTQLEEKAQYAFLKVSESGSQNVRATLRHSMFNLMPPNLLKELIVGSIPRRIEKGHILCKEGDPASSFYITVYGTLEIQGVDISVPIEIPPGQIIGEFSLWIPNSKRTATIKAKEESLILEIEISLFSIISGQSHDMENQIYQIIRRRLLVNIFNLKYFFPGLSQNRIDKFLTQTSLVEKYFVGQQLDLSDAAYILFQGKICLEPSILNQRTRHTYHIVANGHFTREAVVGVIDKPDDPYHPIDGQFATIIEECVAVRINHSVLLELFNECPEVQDVWDGIWGCRYRTLSRLSA